MLKDLAKICAYIAYWIIYAICMTLAICYYAALWFAVPTGFALYTFFKGDLKGNIVAATLAAIFALIIEIVLYLGFYKKEENIWKSKSLIHFIPRMFGSIPDALEDWWNKKFEDEPSQK